MEFVISFQNEQKNRPFFYLTALTAAISESEEMLENRSSKCFSEASDGLCSYIMLPFSCIYYTSACVIGISFIGVIVGLFHNPEQISFELLLFCCLQEQCVSKEENWNFNHLLDWLLLLSNDLSEEMPAF